jgi:hypothetical protein
VPVACIGSENQIVQISAPDALLKLERLGHILVSESECVLAGQYQHQFFVDVSYQLNSESCEEVVLVRGDEGPNRHVKGLVCLYSLVVPPEFLEHFIGVRVNLIERLDGFSRTVECSRSSFALVFEGASLDVNRLVLEAFTNFGDEVHHS